MQWFQAETFQINYQGTNICHYPLIVIFIVINSSFSMSSSNILFFLVAFCFQSKVSGQFFDDFSNDLASWNGDVNHFIINNNQQLQLNASMAGSSFIYRETEFPDEFSAIAYINLNFPPSDNNKLRWYFYSSGSNLAQSDGYFIQIGENGSNDAISFFRFSSGHEVELARGTMAAVAESPMVRMTVEKDNQNFWIVKADYSGENFQEVELEFFEDEIPIEESGIFGFQALYTATRTTGVFIDDTGIDLLVEDMIPPGLIQSFIFDNNSIQIAFNELIEPGIASNPDNYLLKEPAIRPAQVIVERNKVILQFEFTFQSGPLYELSVINIEDLAGNKIMDLVVQNLYLSVSAAIGDLIINEILFNPKTGEDDFIEVYNISDKIINIEGLRIFNSQNERSQIIQSRYDLFPDEYLAIAILAEQVRESYQVPQEANIIQNVLPAFNNSDGNVTLFMGEDVIDKFDYEENYHSPIINNPKGVSLERINKEAITNERNNWTSASASVNFASPGYRNSATIDAASDVTDFVLRHKTFSPNGDGDKDVLIIDYDLDKSNYVAKITIFTDSGHPVKTLINNFTLASKGFIQWDGTDENGQIARMGIYIIIIEIFHPEGSSRIIKLPAVLARQL